jgi:transcriptional regulator with XRE-family HTH domain
MEEAAQQAGLNRTTLYRWESGAVQPRLSELTSLLSTLKVTETQKRQALGMIEAPRPLRQIRQEITDVAERRGMPPCPTAAICSTLCGCDGDYRWRRQPLWSR